MTTPPTTLAESTSSNGNIVAYSSAQYSGMPQFTVVTSSGQHGVWTPVQRDQDTYVITGHVVEPPTDDIIQKSLAISGISQEIIEGSQTPRHESVVVEIQTVDDDSVEPVLEDEDEDMAENEVDDGETLKPELDEDDPRDALVAEAVEMEPERPRTCETCGETFDSIQLLLFHSREHTATCQYECACCNALFRLSSELQKHVKTCKMAVQARPYQCCHCDQAFFKRSAYHRHMVQHKDTKTRFACEVCAKTFASLSYMKKHAESHQAKPEPEKKVVDDESKENDKEAEKENETAEHEELAERRDVFRSLRKRKKLNLAELILDTDDENDEDLMEGTVVIQARPAARPTGAAKPRKPKTSPTEKRIRVGRQPKPSTVNKKQFSCGKCGIACESPDERRKHVQTHVTTLTDKEHMCFICGKSYTMVCNLERHSLIHTNTRLHRCDLCGKGFHRVDILDRHRRIHTGEKPHACPQCDLRFISTSALLTHRKRAHMDKQFSCDKCSDTFLTEKLLERHKKCHSANRRFTCDKCGKSFINSSNLKTHIRIHTKEKPFVCDHCGERFTQKAHVERHILVHTRPKPKKDEENPPLNAEAIQQFVKQMYYCPTCNKSFPKRRGLRMHQRMRHGLTKSVKTKPDSLVTDRTQAAQQVQVQPNPQTWFPPTVQQPQIAPQQQPQQPQQQQPGQQQIQYTVPGNQVQHCTVYNTTNGNVYTQQYLPQGLNQQFDIQIQQMGHEEPVVFTAADSHDTIMYLIEAAASNSLINQPLQGQNQIQMIIPEHFHTQNGEQRYSEIHIQQGGQIIQSQQIQIQQQPMQQQQEHILSDQGLVGKKDRRTKIEKSAAGPKPYKCASCGEFFGSSGVLVKHMRTHTGEKPYTCTHCGKAFTQIGNLHRHIKSHQGVRNYRCNVCGKTFTRRERLLYHCKTHTGEKNFKCGECGKEFSHKVNLMAHYNRRHSEYKPHQCTVCGKAFFEKRALKFHFKTHYSKSAVKDHACGECGRGFISEDRLEKHKRVHSNNRPHKCGLCTKAYTNIQALKAHVNTHHRPKVAESERVSCHICNRRYDTKAQLACHIKLHEDPKYECEICNKKFAVRTNLKTHLRVHSGERPFSCEKCGLAFTQRGHLMRHARCCVRKQYKCLECPLSFQNVQALSRHINKAHGLPPKREFPCKRCDLHFSTAISLENHVKVEHPTSATSVNDDSPSEDDQEENKTNESGSKVVKSRESGTKCQTCPERFIDETKLKSHMVLCRSKKQKVKNSTTSENSTVNRSPAKKKSNKMFKCAQCTCCFSTILQLRNHARKHTDPVLKCQRCGVKFDGSKVLELQCKVCDAETKATAYVDADSQNDTAVNSGSQEKSSVGSDDGESTQPENDVDSAEQT